MFEHTSRPTTGLLLACLAWGWAVAALADDRVVLKNGRQYEGTIVKEDDKYVHLQTADRKRVFRKTEIREIVRDRSEQEQAALPQKFSELSPLGQQVRNARAECILGKYDAIVVRLEPLIAEGGESPEMSQARWLLIEAYERLGRFDDATRLLKETTVNAPQADRIRAQAHLDIFEQNEGYKLERINNNLARNFLPRELYLEGKSPGALADKEMMDRALREYVDQVLRNPKVSLPAFKESLVLDETVERIRSMPPAGGLEKHLPYGEMLGEVAESLERAHAILPHYADGYMLDLVRTEAEHLSGAIEIVFRDLVGRYPESFSYAYDPVSGKLTKEGRERWRENCETFLSESKPLTLVVRYQLKKVAPYGRELRDLNRQLGDTLDRLEQMREAITRKKDSRIYV